MNFEILRNMETFTQKMFNSIIGFQEKDHPAWNQMLSFDDRIKEIPLHYLMFSNADRNPKTHGPTIAHYYPLQFEMAKIAAYAKKLNNEPTICDVHARNGFIGSLLARKGVKVIGLRDENDKPNQIENFFDEKCYKLKSGTISNVDFPVDVIFSSWMPSGLDITEEIAKINPKLVVYIFTKHTSQENGEPQTGTASSFGEHLPSSYKLIDEWAVTRQKDLLHEIWPDLTGNLEETRFVRIYANSGYHDLQIDDADIEVKGYDWENDLLMAETALEAKNKMQQQGFPTHF